MSLRAKLILSIGALALSGPVVSSGCASAPQTRSGQNAFVTEADGVLASLRTENPGLDALVKRAHGYVVFPHIGKGGLLVGGAHGSGVVYEAGQAIGFVELNQASIGLQLGGQTFSEIIVFETPADLEELKDGRFSLGASASAVILSAGAARGLEFEDGVAVAIKPRGGLMVDLSVSGQQLNFRRGPERAIGRQ